MEQQLDNLPKKEYRDGYEEYIVKYNKFNFFKKPLKPYVPESSALKYAAIAGLFLLLPTALKSSSSVVMINEILTLLSYGSSIFFGISAYFKFKEYNLPARFTPLSKPIALMVVSMMLAALPTMMTIASEATFSSGTPVISDTLSNAYST